LMRSYTCATSLTAPSPIFRLQLLAAAAAIAGYGVGSDEYYTDKLIYGLVLIYIRPAAGAPGASNIWGTVWYMVARDRACGIRSEQVIDPSQ
jgi:hypothetical protein